MPLRSDRVSARVGDACQIPQDLQPVAGIFSCFGLQQMPEPKQVCLLILFSLCRTNIVLPCTMQCCRSRARLVHVGKCNAACACMQVLGNWISALAPGGMLAVCYWPPADGQRDAAWRALTDPSLHKPAATIERWVIEALPSRQVAMHCPSSLTVRPCRSNLDSGTFWQDTGVRKRTD